METYKNIINLTQITNLLSYIKFFFYNYFVGHYTQKLYKNFLRKIPEESVVLDIGIGNGFSLIKNSDLIKSKKIKVVGIDIDSPSINLANTFIKENKLEDLIEAHNQNIYNYKTKEKYDYIYFSNSYSVIPNVHEMIDHVKDNYLKKDGEIVISTTIENNFNFVKQTVKPNMKYLFFGIDFGRLTLMKNFVNTIRENKLFINYLENSYHNWYPFWGNIDIFTFYLKKDN